MILSHARPIRGRTSLDLSDINEDRAGRLLWVS